jgi:hypothetical protein
MEPNQLEELQTVGFTVVRGLFDSDTCRAARTAIDTVLGPDTAETVEVAGEVLGHNSGNSNFIHTISHPNPALAVIAAGMPRLAEAHAASLCSEVCHMILNGQHYIRTDPNPEAVAVVGSGWHVDNAFLVSHESSSPRHVYTRSIVTLSEGGVEPGGGGIMISPSSVGVTRDRVARLVAKQGLNAYHGSKWRTEIVHELTEKPTTQGWHGSKLKTSAGLEEGIEILSGEGE